MSTGLEHARVCLAFGCFHFSPRLEAGDRFDMAEYPDAVTRALEESVGIDQVRVHVDSASLRRSAVVPGPAPALDERAGPFPKPTYCRIQFDVRVPSRIQQELLGTKDLTTYGIDTEHFRVHIEYGYEMPVAAVEMIGGGDRARPSRAVNLVRRFLAREFERSPHHLIAFECLGPSPAHSDFYLVPMDRPEGVADRFWRLEHRVNGYHRYCFGFRPEEVGGSMSPARAFLAEALTEMSLFYGLVQERTTQMRAWAEIEQGVSELMEMLQRGGIRGFLGRAFRSSRRINEVQMALVQFQCRDVMVGGDLRRRIAQLYREPGSKTVRELVEARFEDRVGYPVQEIAELARMLDTRRSADRDVLMLGLASIFGGALGAVGGLLAA